MKDDELEKMLGALEEEPPPLPGEARREQILDAMVQATRSPRRGRWRWSILALAGVAAALALGLGWQGRSPSMPGGPSPVGVARSVAGEALLVRGGLVQKVQQAELELRLGDRLNTLADGRATARLGFAFASLSPMTELTVVPEGCELRAGAASFEVDPLPRGRRFLVGTPDILVEVHGTAFRVVVTPGAPTRVLVSEGVVSVSPRSGDPGAKLLAGEQWPLAPSAASVAAPAASSASPVAPQAPPSAPVPSSSVASVHPRSTPAAAGSDLAEQNRLLLEAADAKRRGDASAEKKALDAYLRRFPDAPGAHDALAGKMRAAAKGKDPRDAVRAAKAYLATYPRGPLAVEARSIIARHAP